MPKYYFTFFLLVFALSACVQKQNDYKQVRGFAQGTTYNIIYQGDEDFSTAFDSILNVFDLSLSIYKENSIISQMNRNVDSIKADSFFTTVFKKSMEVSQETGGSFDISVGPLVRAYGFGPEDHQFPSKSETDSLMSLIGYQNFKLENKKLIKRDPRGKLDVNAIAQGYSVDVIANFLEQHHTQNYLVEIGGEIIAKGKNRKQEIWKVGIDKPIDDQNMEGNHKIRAVVALENCALATSGNYRKFYIHNGVKYAHTIDPITGKPVVHQLLSVTVLAPDCMTADAYATAFMVMGTEKSLDLIKRHPELKAYFIEAGQNNTYHEVFSPGFEEAIIETYD